MKVEDFINQTEVTKYFILDSHDTGTSGQNGTVFEDEDYVTKTSHTEKVC